MCIEHLTAKELSQRWHLSPCTLERWRREGLGPQFLKVGQRILYRISDVEAYEKKRNMTLLQIANLPEQELCRLHREATKSVNESKRGEQRVRNAKYLQRMAKAKEIAFSLAEQDEGGEA